MRQHQISYKMEFQYLYFINNMHPVLYDTYAKLTILEMKGILYNINGLKA